MYLVDRLRTRRITEYNLRPGYAASNGDCKLRGIGGTMPGKQARRVARSARRTRPPPVVVFSFLYRLDAGFRRFSQYHP